MYILNKPIFCSHVYFVTHVYMYAPHFTSLRYNVFFTYALNPFLHYRIHWLCRVPVTLGKGQFALGKLFAECYTRQTPLGKASHGKAIFAECRISGTRQRLCREPWHSAKQPRGTTLGRHFAECQTPTLGKV